MRVEALLAAAAAPVPPPACDLVPDATLADDLFPEDLPRLLGLLGRADLYLQDEVEVALHPTLTRVWSRAGRSGQRLVQAPGTNYKQYGFGLVDWRDGHLDWAVADGRRAVPLCAQLRRAVARSRSRGKIAMVILDNLGIHTPKLTPMRGRTRSPRPRCSGRSAARSRPTSCRLSGRNSIMQHDLTGSI